MARVRHEDFARSAERLAGLASDVHVVLVHHWLRYATLPFFLREVADGARDLLSGDVRPIARTATALGSR